MSTGRFLAPGRTRSCPHCKATILDSAVVCPGCHHHLRFDAAESRAQESATPLRVDGILRHPPNGETWEYSVVLAIRNGRGEEISRQVVGVGALSPEEERTFTLAVEVFKPVAAFRSGEAVKATSSPIPAPTVSSPAVPARRPTDSPKPGAPAQAAAPLKPARISPGIGRRWPPSGSERDPKRS